jgi:hypothetical protein
MSSPSWLRSAVIIFPALLKQRSHSADIAGIGKISNAAWDSVGKVALLLFHHSIRSTESNIHTHNSTNEKIPKAICLNSRNERLIG